MLAGPQLGAALQRAPVEHPVRAEVAAVGSVRRFPQVLRLVGIAGLVRLLRREPGLGPGAIAFAASVPTVLAPTQYSRRPG